jgi:hypothetical protein
VEIQASRGRAQSLADGSWEIATGGSETFWGQADECHFVYRTLEGDGAITARILSHTTSSNSWAEAGLMARDSDLPASPHFTVGMGSSYGVFQHWRPVPAAYRLFGAYEGEPRAAPLYLRLERRGDLFSGFVSPDGVSWARLGSAQRIRMRRDLMIGLYVTAYETSAHSTARVDQVTVSADLPPTGPVEASALVRDRAALLVWDSAPAARGYHVYRQAPGDAGFLRVTRQPLTGLSYTDGGLKNGARYRYRVTALIDEAETLPSSVATARPMAPVQGLTGYEIGLFTEGEAAAGPGGSITVRSTGGDIGDRSDRCYFLTRPAEGNAILTARLPAPFERAEEYAKVGVMVREGLGPEARYATLVFTPKYGGYIQSRRVLSEGTAYAGVIVPPTYPSWLRLTRHGDTIQPLLSLDGFFFEPAGDPIHFPHLGRDLWFGLVVAASHSERPCIARFDQVSLVE